MADRSARFVEDLSEGLVGKQPVKLWQLFGAKNVKEMMMRAKNMPTSLDVMLQEAPAYLGGLVIKKTVDMARAQTVVPPECAFAIHIYTRNEVYAELNQQLRDGEDLQDFQHLCVCLIKGLALLPPYVGKVFRSIGNVQHGDVLKAVHKDVVWTWGGFSSASTAEETTAKFGKYPFVIHSQYGRDISALSQFPGEQEVLFVPGTRLRVLEVDHSSCVMQEYPFSDFEMASSHNESMAQQLLIQQLQEQLSGAQQRELQLQQQLQQQSIAQQQLQQQLNRYQQREGQLHQQLNDFQQRKDSYSKSSMIPNSERNSYSSRFKSCLHS